MKKVKTTVIFLIAVITFFAYAAAPSTPEPVEQARKFLESGDYTSAGRMLRSISGRALTAEERSLLSECYYRAANDAVKRKEMEQAENLFNLALQADSGNARAYHDLARIYQAGGGYVEALQAFNLAVFRDPSRRDAVTADMRTMAVEILEGAEQDLRRGDLTIAYQKIVFVRDSFAGVMNSNLQTRLNGYVRELAAIELYATAERQLASLVGRNRDEELRTRLESIASNYPDTKAGTLAKDGVLSLGGKVDIDATATGFKIGTAWRRTESERFSVYYQKGMSTEAFMRLGDSLVERIMRNLGITKYPLDRKIRMYLFEDRNTWAEFLKENSDRTMHWSSGFAIPSAGEIYIYATDRASDLRRKILPHELTHIIHVNHAGSRRYQPMWLIEGLAKCEEESGVKDARRFISNYGKRLETASISWMLNTNIRSSDELAVSMFYARSAVLVDMIKSKYGSQKVLGLINAFAERRANDRDDLEFHRKVFKEVLQTDFETLEKNWLKEMR